MIAGKGIVCNGSESLKAAGKTFMASPVVKIMATVFCYKRSILLVGLIERRTIINSGAFCGTLKKLIRAIKKKPWHVVKRNFTPPQQRKALHFWQNSGLGIIFRVGRLLLLVIQPQLYSKRFPPFSAPRTRSLREELQWWRISENGLELLAVREGGRLH